MTSGVVHRPGPCAPGGRQILRGERSTELVKAAGSNGKDCGQVRGCAGALVRLCPGPDYLAGQCVLLRHDEGAEVHAGLLGKYPAIAILRGQHPVEVPLNLCKKARQPQVPERDIHRKTPEAGGKHLPGLQQGAAGDSRVHDIAAVVVTPPGLRQDSALAGGGMERSLTVAGGVFIAATQVYGEPAALPVECPHRGAQSLPVDVRCNPDRQTMRAVYLAGAGQGGEYGLADPIS